MRKDIKFYLDTKRKIILSCVLFILLVYISCYHYTSVHEFGITFNFTSGVIKPDDHTGHHFTPPWVLAAKIDTRPVKVCIASATRNLDCRLVQFDPSKYKELIRYEGFHYYWWYNRFSFNSGQHTYRGVDNLLLGHAYGQYRCSCVEIIQTVGDDQQTQ